MISVNDKLGQAVVGLAGLGGLGSAVAVALVRAGVGRLIIADFDIVDNSNLSRQQYFVDQVGKSKVDATIGNLQRINPNVQVEGYKQKLNAYNVPGIFAKAEVIAECLDKAEEKQMIVETVLSRMKKTIIVSVSGLAGYGNSNAIQTRCISPRLILVGDNENSIDSGQPLVAPRVGVAAHHQANAIVEVIVDEIKK